MTASADAAHVTALSLRRFRSHIALDLELDQRPIAIFGPNGVGKTNILEAVSLLAPGRGLRGAKAEEIAGRPNPIGWAVRGSVLQPEGDSEIVSVSVDLREGVADRGKRKVLIDGASAPQAALAERLKILWLTPAMDRLWIEGAAERRKFLDRAVMAFDPAHGPRAARYEQAMRERSRLLKEGGASPAWLDALERRMAEEGVAIDAARRATLAALESAQTSAAEGDGAFPQAALSLDAADAMDGAVWAAGDIDGAAAALGRGRFRDAAAGRALTGPHRQDLGAHYVAKDAPARQCSTGEQKALLISLILAIAQALRMSGAGAPVLLLDEVAAHLDDGRRAALYDALTAMGVQAWLTGTGPELFTALGERTQRFQPEAL